MRAAQRKKGDQPSPAAASIAERPRLRKLRGSPTNEEASSAVSLRLFSGPLYSTWRPEIPMKLNDTLLSLPPQQVSLDVLLEKYTKGDEKTVEDVRRRVARALAAVETDPARWEPVFYEALENGFIPGGRIDSAAGTHLQA